MIETPEFKKHPEDSFETSKELVASAKAEINQLASDIKLQMTKRAAALGKTRTFLESQPESTHRNELLGNLYVAVAKIVQAETLLSEILDEFNEFISQVEIDFATEGIQDTLKNRWSEVRVLIETRRNDSYGFLMRISGIPELAHPEKYNL